MQPDKKTIDRLLALNDDKLRLLLRKLLERNGIDPAAVPLDSLDLGRLREAVGQATEEDVTRFLELFSILRGEGGR